MPELNWLHTRICKLLAAVLASAWLWLAAPVLLAAESTAAPTLSRSTLPATTLEDSAMDRTRAVFARFSCSYPEFAALERAHPAHPWSKWGLGVFEDEYVSNDRAYEWYINQNRTGKYGFENCGPASVTMACMWSDPYFAQETEAARATYHPDGGWWYMDDIASYMDLYDIPYSSVENRGNKAIMDHLRQGRIIIINIDLRELSYNPNASLHVDKFYEGGSGHFIILKGFAVVDGKIFFECYDPATQNYYYSFDRYSNSGDPMGRDRYYRGDEIQRAMYNWYNQYLVVEPRY